MEASDTNNLNNDATSRESGTSTTELVLAFGLFVLMVGVGASCKINLLRKMFQSPKALRAAAVGVICQFVLMPVVAYLLTLVFKMEGYTALGVVLAGSMPGGSSSNVFVMWSQGILELSVFMTILSTLVSFGMTPLWLYIFSNVIDGVADTALAIDQIAITLGMLVVPLSIGVSLNCFACLKRVRHHIEQGLGVLAVIIFAAAIVILAVEYPDSLREYATWQVYVSAALFFPIAAVLSYAITTFLKFKPSIQRTVVVEVGLQNLALAFAIGERQPNISEAQQNQALPFPLLYAMFMYFWCAVLVPISRWQKRRNEVNGIVDIDPDFFLGDNDDGDGDDGENGDDKSLTLEGNDVSDIDNDMLPPKMPQ